MNNEQNKVRRLTLAFVCYDMEDLTSAVDDCQSVDTVFHIVDARKQNGSYVVVVSEQDVDKVKHLLGKEHP